MPTWNEIIGEISSQPNAFDLSKKWSKTMFDGWLKTNMFLDDEDKENKAAAIIAELGSHALTLSHDRHLSVDILKGLGLKIIDLEADNELQDKVLSLHHSCIITMTQTSVYKLIENQDGKAYIQLAK